MNKRGFTLIEVLAVIAIIALLLAVGVVAYSRIISRTTNEYFEKFRDTMHAEAIYYVTKHPNDINWSNNTATLSLASLAMDPIKNPKNSKDLCSNSYVTLTRSRVGNVLSITYNVCLVCPNTTFESGFNMCKTYEN